ncbi:MAG: hypothetical protein WAV31_04830 [Candidatus Moraniibacteriota bacterium]
MSYKFSQELREKLIAYFLRVHKVEISQDKADEYLDSMADLYCAFSQRNAKDKFSPAKQ